MNDPVADLAAAVAAATTPSAGPAELPPPDRSLFVGATRVVNLFADPSGLPTEIDVWARRTISSGPVLVASGVPFGAASDHFAVPPGVAIDIVGAGAGPEGLALAPVVPAGKDERVTAVFTNGDAGAASTVRIVERGTGDALGPAAPASGRACSTWSLRTPARSTAMIRSPWVTGVARRVPISGSKRAVRVRPCSTGRRRSRSNWRRVEAS